MLHSHPLLMPQAAFLPLVHPQGKRNTGTWAPTHICLPGHIDQTTSLEPALPLSSARLYCILPLSRVLCQPLWTNIDAHRALLNWLSASGSTASEKSGLLGRLWELMGAGGGETVPFPATVPHWHAPSLTRLLHPGLSAGTRSYPASPLACHVGSYSFKMCPHPALVCSMCVLTWFRSFYGFQRL